MPGAVRGDESGMGSLGHHPDRPRAVRSLKKPPPGTVLTGGDLDPSTSRWPSALTPMQQGTNRDHPASLTDLQHERVGTRRPHEGEGLASARDRVWNCSTWASTRVEVLAILLACDVLSPVFPSN